MVKSAKRNAEAGRAARGRAGAAFAIARGHAPLPGPRLDMVVGWYTGSLAVSALKA